MLIRFTVENYLSFQERTEFNMIATADQNKLHHVVYNSKDQESIKLLRGSIIYGANASGKSNLIKAMAFAQDFIVEGVAKNKNIILNKFRLNQSCQNKPSRFEFELRVKGKQYAYGFIIDNNKVHEEWLYEIGTKEKEDCIYERNENKIKFNFHYCWFKNIENHNKNRLLYEADSTRQNLLFLTNCKERNITYFENIYNWFDDILNIIFPESKAFILPVFIHDQKETELFSKILNKFDLGIDKLTISKINLNDYSEIPQDAKDEINKQFPFDNEEFNSIFSPQYNCIITYDQDNQNNKYLQVYQLSTIKKSSDNLDINFKIEEESDGTQRIIDLIPMLITLAQSNSIFIIDEIERSLHTLLIRKIFDLVLNNRDFTNKESQIIATTHDVNLLDIEEIFRKDEIWFVEKNKHGESITYSLANTDVENLDLTKGYLKGRFGAIPFLQDIKDLSLKN